MTFYLIGIGLEIKSLSIEAQEIIKKADKVYLENYTVEFPYSFEDLEKIIGRIIPLSRLMVENEKFVEDAKTKNIVLLIYGAPMMATTHISLILKCKKENIDFRILENASIFDAISETGLQIYKFGRTASMPSWNKDYKPSSFIDIVKNNEKIKAHSLILVDIGLKFQDALKQLEEASKDKIKLNKMVVCSRIGTKESKIFYSSKEELKKENIHSPFCFIIPGELHFLEEEALNELKS